VDWLYSLAQPFVWHPARAALVSLAFVLLALAFRRTGWRPLLIAAASWAVFAGLEFMAWRERADIRVDLLVTWPVLCLVTVASLAMWARGQLGPKPKTS
jgi:hypothetical protein